MATCSKCDAWVSDDFVRVFGDNNDEIIGCPECTAMNEIRGDNFTSALQF